MPESVRLALCRLLPIFAAVAVSPRGAGAAGKSGTRQIRNALTAKAPDTNSDGPFSFRADAGQDLSGGAPPLPKEAGFSTRPETGSGGRGLWSVCVYVKGSPECLPEGKWGASRIEPRRR